MRSRCPCLPAAAIRPYVFGLTTSLISKGAAMDLIGSDELDFPEFRDKPGLNFLNLRGMSAGRMSASEKGRPGCRCTMPS